MKQAVLSNFNLPWLPIIALFIFVVCFAAYAYWTYKKENKAMYDEVANIPMNEPNLVAHSKNGGN